MQGSRLRVKRTILRLRTVSHTFLNSKPSNKRCMRIPICYRGPCRRSLFVPLCLVFLSLSVSVSVPACRYVCVCGFSGASFLFVCVLAEGLLLCVCICSPRSLCLSRVCFSVCFGVNDVSLSLSFAAAAAVAVAFASVAFASVACAVCLWPVCMWPVCLWPLRLCPVRLCPAWTVSLSCVCVCIFVCVCTSVCVCVSVSVSVLVSVSVSVYLTVCLSTCLSACSLPPCLIGTIPWWFYLRIPPTRLPLARMHLRVLNTDGSDEARQRRQEICITSQVVIAMGHANIYRGKRRATVAKFVEYGPHAEWISVKRSGKVRESAVRVQRRGVR